MSPTEQRDAAAVHIFAQVHQQARALWQTWMDSLAVGDKVGVHTGKTRFVAGKVVACTSTKVEVEIPGWSMAQRFRRKDGLLIGGTGSDWVHKVRIIPKTEHVQSLIDRSALLGELNHTIDKLRSDHWANVSNNTVRHVLALLKGGGV